MPLKHELESYCFVDENGVEKSMDFGCPSTGTEFIVGATNLSFNSSSYGQILIEQINQLQRNNKKLLEIEHEYKLFINSLIETVKKRDRTVYELELKLSKNASNLLKLQLFLKNKLNEMEIYKRKYVHEKWLNRQHRHLEQPKPTVSESFYLDGNDGLEGGGDVLKDLTEICLVCEHRFSFTSHRIADDDDDRDGDVNCCGVVIDESLDEI